MYHREKTYNGSYTERMVTAGSSSRSPNAGVTNYYLPVYAAAAGCDPVSEELACVLELLLWFFDSRGGKYYRTHTRQPGWVDETVVDWFMATSRQLADQYGRVVPSIAHPGINDNKINGQSHGWPRNANNATRTGDRGGYTGRDVPFMQALVATPGLIGLFYGHDHGNTWCYRWTGKLDGLDVDAGIAGAGLHLCYGQHTDYGGYGYWVRGERQIVATRKGLRNGTLDTHTMLETGEVVGKVTLNSTFNDDVYDTVPNVKTFMPLSAGKESTSLAVTLRPALAVLALLLFCNKRGRAAW
ncbi:calcineurin-like phosphoesterase [Beauveria bassiana ARSEF 2860]|uniref:Calcineurin-like phosphoesterase n=1 Tax=Beauveria bassiana (strain ARSEF 2860) TaxID=655819 RepID=J4WMF4_BEAB2|nr:calcineurin-like phosphoesterase [Beauveria bassiana ARSEF 2860]EJP70870.1 calcineurin-like phosphoesterase [Beauveria bassiana ARSEF 2860]